MSALMMSWRAATGWIDGRVLLGVLVLVLIVWMRVEVASEVRRAEQAARDQAVAQCQAAGEAAKAAALAHAARSQAELARRLEQDRLALSGALDEEATQRAALEERLAILQAGVSGWSAETVKELNK